MSAIEDKQRALSGTNTCKASVSPSPGEHSPRFGGAFLCLRYRPCKDPDKPVLDRQITEAHVTSGLLNFEEVFMVYDRDPDQDLSNRPPPAKHTRWELSTLVIGLIVILTGS